EDYGSAEEHVRRILQAGGASAEALVNLGVAFKGMGQLDKAMQAYDAAQKLNANLPALALNRGVIIGLKGNPEQAIAQYRQFISLSGGEMSVNANHAVFDLIKEQETVIASREEAKKAEEEARRMEEEAKQQEAATKEEERKAKEAEFKKQQDAAKGKAAADAVADEKAEPPAAEATPKPETPAKVEPPARANPPVRGTGSPRGAQRREDPKKEEPKKEDPASEPGKKKAPPPDEPSDGL
ncbi:MAG: hypothetical protein INH41_14000, partial [Myxococcaceae bacterium]|nr:hypothetical protein [Myxococcaceae bacterium]